MRHGIRSGVLAFVAALAVAGAPCLSGDPRPHGAAGIALRDFLYADCGAGEDGGALVEVKRHGDVVVPPLARALRDGPEARTVARVRRDLEDEWTERQAFLAGKAQTGLDPAALQAALSLTRDEFVEAGHVRFVQGIRERAAMGLAAVGSSAALRALDEARAFADPELSRIIAVALEHFAVPSRPPAAAPR
jgi:hypothetical protein